MTSMSRRLFGARALGTAAAASAVAAGLGPVARAQSGSLGGGTSSPAPSPTPGAEPVQAESGVIDPNFRLTAEQLAEVDTSVPIPPTPQAVDVPVENSPFRAVADRAGAYVESVQQLDDRTFFAHVWSPSNQRTMRVGLMVPPHWLGPRPTLYCLDGYADFRPEGEDTLASAWYWAGGGHEFFMDKNVNVVFTIDAGPTMYRDFVSPQPGRGPVKWETFLTKELPPLVDEACQGNGRNGLIGISSGAIAAFMTAVRNRSLYTTIAGLSGVYDVDNTFGKSLWSHLWKQKGIEASTVMGGWFNSQWRSNDPYAIFNGNTQSLRGKTIYLSASAGLPTGEDWGNVQENPDPVLLGGPFEATAFSATKRFAFWLALNRVRVTQDYRLYGVHDWPLWRRQLPFAWPTIAKGLGVDGQTPAPADVTLR